MYDLLTKGNENPTTWKGCGIWSMDGVLYMTVCRQTYGTQQTSQNCSIIKSANGGQDWITANGQNISPPKDAAAMFNARQNSAPFFLMYGRDGLAPAQDNASKYVYLYTAASGTTAIWNNGDGLYLARVLRSDLRANTFDASTYTYYKGGDGMADSSWDSDPANAIPVLSKQGSISMTAPFWVPPAKIAGSTTGRYLLPMWYQDSANAPIHTVWDLYESPTPWGPWTAFQTMDWPGYAFYNVAVWQPSLYDSGASITLTATGDNDQLPPIKTKYSPHFLEVELSTGGVPRAAGMTTSAGQSAVGDIRRFPPRQVPAVPGEGLYAFYDFSEQMGTVAHDSSGNQRHAATDGRWFAGAGGLGTARVAVNTNITASLAGDLTMVFVFRHTIKRSGTQDDITNYERVVDKGGLFWFYRPGTAPNTFICQIGAASVSSDALTDDQWHIITCRRQGSTLDLLEGTTLLGSASATPVPSDNSTLYLGGSSGPYNQLFGWMNCFGLWTRALNDAEIAGLTAYLTRQLTDRGWSPQDAAGPQVLRKNRFEYWGK